MALISVLLMSVILLVLGVSFLYFLERDYRFAGRQEKEMQARYMALAGLRYYLHRPDLFVAGASMPVVRYVPASGTAHYFEVEVDPGDGTVRSRGVVSSALGVVAERTLVVEPGSSVLEHLDTSL
ncbi:MAG: hypothetical protein HY319_01400 [Armatimonadetes bacterium]|nr:hypothetical protein [Armatimonadota bacterium]